MEEKKILKEQENQSQEEKKFTYEQLEQIANNLNSQRNQLYEKLQEAQELIANFNDIGMLLSIIDRGENFDSAFIDRCTTKVQSVVEKLLDKADSKEEKQ